MKLHLPCLTASFLHVQQYFYSHYHHFLHISALKCTNTITMPYPQSTYTPFLSYNQLIVCFDFLDSAIDHIHVINPGSFTNSQNRQRSLTPLKEFFLILCQLRSGLTVQNLAYQFQLSQSTTLQIFVSQVYQSSNNGHLMIKFRNQCPKKF